MMTLLTISEIVNQLSQLMEQWGYIGLFSGAFLAATIVPFPSEIIFVACITALNPPACIIIATIGNTLGALTLYWMGTLGKLRWLCVYGRIPPNKLRRFVNKAQKWGPVLAMLSFLPAIGQLIVISLGLLHCDLVRSTTFIILGKGIRYTILACVTLGALQFMS